MSHLDGRFTDVQERLDDSRRLEGDLSRRLQRAIRKEQEIDDMYSNAVEEYGTVLNELEMMQVVEEDLRDQIALLQEREAELEAGSWEQELELEDLRPLREERERLVAERSAAAFRAAALEERLAEAWDSAARREDQLKRSTDAVAELTSQLEESRAGERALQEELRVAKLREEDLRTKIDIGREREGDLQDELVAAKEREQRLQDQLHNMLQGYRQLEEEREAQDQELQAEQTRTAALVVELATARQQQADLSDQLQAARRPAPATSEG